MTDIDPPIVSSPNGSSGACWTFDLVEACLVEAMRLWWRSPDRERGWHLIRSCWPEIRQDSAEEAAIAALHAEEAKLRPLPLTRDQLAERDAISEWLALVPERDRRIVGLALGQLAAGRKAVSWTRIRRRLSAEIGTRGLGQRYRRAIAGIAGGLNAGLIGGEVRGVLEGSAE